MKIPSTTSIASGTALSLKHARTREAGFTLMETTIALVLLMIVGLGAASLFTYSIYNNSAGSDRATALAVAQQAMEQLRNTDFNLTTTDASLAAGTYTQTGVIRDGREFTVVKIIDDDPATTAVDVNTATTLKKITVSVTAKSIGRGWATGAFATITLVSQRAKCDYK
jgi:Tfp pilus assembly protein PilV